MNMPPWKEKKKNCSRRAGKKGGKRKCLHKQKKACEGAKQTAEVNPLKMESKGGETTRENQGGGGGGKKERGGEGGDLRNRKKTSTSGKKGKDVRGNR